MISEKLNSVHKLKEAIPGQIYKDVDGQVYEGTQSGRLKLLPNYKDVKNINSDIKETNTSLEALTASTNASLASIAQSIQNIISEIAEIDNIIVIQDYTDTSKYYGIVIENNVFKIYTYSPTDGVTGLVGELDFIMITELLTALLEQQELTNKLLKKIYQ